MKMRGHRILPGVLTATVALVGVAADGHRLVERLSDPGAERSFGKLLVVAITADRAVRHRFEDKFVSHLRGRGIEGVTSHSLVPDLQIIENKQQVISTLVEQEVDGAISIRAVPLVDRTEDEWGAAWREDREQERSLRQLIDDSLPASGDEAKLYGIEVALWDTATRRRVWSGRTDGYTRKEMKKGAGQFVQFVMDALKDDRLL